MVAQHAVFQWLQQMTGNPVIDHLMVLSAEYLILLVPLSLVSIWLLGKEEKKDALYIFGTAVMSLALSYLLGQFYYHQPPFMQYETIIQSQPENSFPSQHTAILFGTAFSLLWRRYRKSGALLSIAAVLTGIARIYIGEHFLVDIVGGVAAALAGLGILFLGRSRFDPHISWLAAKAQALEDRVRQTLLGRAV